jgi:hypothetical protein
MIGAHPLLGVVLAAGALAGAAGGLLALAAEGGGAGAMPLSPPELLVGEAQDPPGYAAGLPDPFVFWDGAEYTIFGTGTRYAHSRTLAPGDMQTGDLSFDLSDPAARGAVQIWSFRPYRHSDGSYHGYGTLHYGFFRTSVAHFLPADGETWTPSRPITHWRFDRILVGDVRAGLAAYDSELYRDTDGALYLIYDSAYPDEVLGRDIHVKAQRMLDPATPDPTWPARPILSPEGLRSEDRNPGGIQIVEGTHIRRMGGKCVLIYSVGDFDRANYKIGLAYSDALIPPPGRSYTKLLRPDPGDLWGSGHGVEVQYLLQTQVEGWPNYCGRWLNGPGIGDIARLADGRWWLIFHARKPGVAGLHGAGRYLWRLPLAVDVDAARPMSEWIRPLLPAK